MQMIFPMTVDDTALEASNVPENDYPEWDPATTYALDAFVMVTGTTHKVYKSTQGGNTGNDPTVEGTIFWTEIGATNRWKAFDRSLGAQVERSESIQHEIRVPAGELVSGIAMLNMEAATVQVQIFDENDVEVDNRLVSAVQSTAVIDWYTWHTAEFDPSSERVFLYQASAQDLPGHAGNRIVTTISQPGGTARVGQIVLGRLHTLGRTVEGTVVDFQDFSVKTQGPLGNEILVERGFARIVDYNVVYPTADGQRVDYLLTLARATPMVWLAGPDTEQLATTTYGWVQDRKLTKAPVNSRARISIQGLAS